MQKIHVLGLALSGALLVAGCGNGATAQDLGGPSTGGPEDASTGDDLAIAAGDDLAVVTTGAADLAMVAPADLARYAVDDGGALVVDAGADATVCAGTGVVLGTPARAGYTYAWSPPAGLDSATAAQPTAKPAVTTTYTLTVTETASGATGSASVTITVNPLPTLAVGPDQWIDAGGSVTIGSAAVAAQSYAWTCNRADCALSSSTDAQPTASPAKSTRYTLVAMTAAGCSAQATTNVWTNLHATTIPDGVATGTVTSGWPENAKLLVTFDQPVDATTINTTNVQLSDVASGGTIPVTLAFDATTSRLYVTPGSGYAQNSDYTLTLKGGAGGVASVDAVQPSVLPVDDAVDYSTGGIDTAAPTVAYSVPANGATAVVMNTSIIVVFNEIVDPASVSASTFTVKTTTGGTAVAGTLSYDAPSATLLFKPSSALAGSTQYTVTMNGIADLSGNAMSNVTLSFTTGAAPDTTPPTVTTFTPTGSGVPVTTLVTVKFSEPIDPTSLGGLGLRNAGTMAAVAGTTTYNAVTQTATFDPTLDLASLTTYTIVVSGVKDLAGNAMAATQTSSFTTAKVLFSDDFESGTAKWTLDTPWGLATNTYRSPTHSLADSPVGSYAQNANVTARLANPVDITGTTTTTLSWFQRIRTSRNKDFFYMEYSFDGATWSTLVNKLSGNVTWATQTVTLPTTGKSTLYVRFRLVDNGDNRQLDGVYLDDVIVQTP